MKKSILFIFGIIILLTSCGSFEPEQPKLYKGKVLKLIEAKGFDIHKMQEIPVYYVIFHSDSIDRNIMFNITPESYFTLTEGGQVKVYLTDSETRYSR